MPVATARDDLAVARRQQVRRLLRPDRVDGMGLQPLLDAGQRLACFAKSRFDGYAYAHRRCIRNSLLP